MGRRTNYSFNKWQQEKKKKEKKQKKLERRLAKSKPAEDEAPASGEMPDAAHAEVDDPGNAEELGADPDGSKRADEPSSEAPRDVEG